MPQIPSESPICWASLLWPHIVSLLIPALAHHLSLGSLCLDMLLTLLGSDPHAGLSLHGALFTLYLCFNILVVSWALMVFSLPLRFWLLIPGCFSLVDAFLIHSDLTLYWPGHLPVWALLMIWCHLSGHPSVETFSSPCSGFNISCWAIANMGICPALPTW